MEPEKSKPDCQTCGACCQHFFNEDLSDFGLRRRGLFIGTDPVDDLPEKMVYVEEFPFLGTHDAWLLGRKVGPEKWQCPALKGEIAKSCSCKIYDRRPRTCREFEAGGEACLNVRNLYQIEVSPSTKRSKEKRGLSTPCTALAGPQPLFPPIGHKIALRKSNRKDHA